MSTILHSIKYLRRLNLGTGGRRLGSSLHRLTNDPLSKPNSWTQCLAGTLTNRNYVTRVASQQNSSLEFGPGKKTKDVDSILNEIDLKIKNNNYINKNDVAEVINAIVRKGTMTSIQALLLIRCCGNFMSSENLKIRQSLMKSAWELIKESDVQLDVSHYNSLLLVNIENESDFSPVDILVEMKEKNIEPNRVTFQRLIEKYCNNGDIAGATKILEHMNQKEIPINEIIFNSLIRGHSIAGDVPRAIEILEIMKKAGIEPSSRTYTELLSVHARKGDMDAIRNTLSDCKQKDIPFSDQEILHIIYIAATNEHHDLVDELITALPRRNTYNKEIVSCIYKLLEKNQPDVAYKLFKGMKKPNRNIDNELNNLGNFFIKKLITTDAKPETIAKYCKLMIEEKLNSNPFESAVLYAYNNNMHHLALPLLKAYKEFGGEIREHFFFPIFASCGKGNNLHDILNTLKSMTFNFEITPSISTIKDYVLPYMVESDMNNAVTLANNNLPFPIVVNAMILHLLEGRKLNQAAQFMYTTNIIYRTNLLVRPLVNALLKTKDVKSFVNIVHFQYFQLINKKSDNLSNEKLEDGNFENQTSEVVEINDSTEINETADTSANQFINSVMNNIMFKLPSYESDLLINILNGFASKGISIGEETARNIQSFIDSEKLTPEIVTTLNQLSSGKLVLQVLNRSRKKQYLFEKRNTIQNNMMDENIELTPEVKMALTTQQARNGNHESVQKLLKELEEENTQYSLGFCAFLIDYYSKILDIKEADKWFQRMLEIDPDSKMDMSKILNYAIALIKSNRIEDAFKILDHPILDQDSDRVILCQKLFRTVSEICPERLDEFFNVLKTKGFFKVVTSQLLSSMIRAPLDAGDIEKAIQKFEWACQNFNVAPNKVILMMELIKKEDAKNLQRVTDLSTKIHGEMNALFDLSVAFLESDRLRQARKILETPGLRLSKNRVMMRAERYRDQKDTKKLENFIQTLTGIFMDMNPLYIMLLEVYEQNGDHQKCISLWTQMQEDNIQPSSEFMKHLEKVLVTYGQEVPFARQGVSENHDNFTESDHEVSSTIEFNKALLEENYEKAEKLLTQLPIADRNRSLVQLAEFYVQASKLDKALSKLELINVNSPVDGYYQDSLKNIIKKLAEDDEFSTIFKILTQLNEVSKKISDATMCRVLNDKYYEIGKYDKFISHIENLLNDPAVDQSAIRSLFHTRTASIAGYKEPKVETKLEEFALKAYSVGFNAPINAYWACKFLKDSSDAEEIFNKYILENPRFQCMNVLAAIRSLKLYEKFPALIEKIIKHQHLNYEVKRKTVSTSLVTLLESDDPNKYNLAYECISRSVKEIPLDRLRQQTLSVIEQNLTNGKTLEIFKEDSKREEEKASG